MDAVLKSEVEEFASKILRSYFCDSEVDFLISTFAPEKPLRLHSEEKRKTLSRVI